MTHRAQYTCTRGPQGSSLVHIHRGLAAPTPSRSVLGSGLPQGLRRGHQHSGAALEPRWGPLDLTSLLALQAM